MYVYLIGLLMFIIRLKVLKSVIRPIQIEAGCIIPHTMGLNTLILEIS